MVSPGPPGYDSESDGTDRMNPPRDARGQGPGGGWTHRHPLTTLWLKTGSNWERAENAFLSVSLQMMPSSPNTTPESGLQLLPSIVTHFQWLFYREPLQGNI